MTERTCRGCGCTEHRACVDPEAGPCWWVEADLCSHCQAALLALRARMQVATDLGSAQAALELRHAAQIERMLAWSLSLPTLFVIDQVRGTVEALIARAGEVGS